VAQLPKADSVSRLPFLQGKEISKETLEGSISVASQKCLSSVISVWIASSLAYVIPGYSAPWQEFIGSEYHVGSRNVGCSSVSRTNNSFYVQDFFVSYPRVRY